MTNFNEGLGWLLLVVSIALGACSKEPTNADKPRPAVASAPALAVPIMPVAAPPPPTPVDAPPSALELVMAQPTLSAAIEIAKPLMNDTDNETSAGALLLGLWAHDHLRLADVAVAKNETSFALVHKDADASRGKRLCARGTIIQITKDSAGLFTGLFLNGYTQLVSFLVAGSTGELVEHSGARICGVVIGTYDYDNSGGGKGHAVSVVGMFDLPENRQAKPSK